MSRKKYIDRELHINKIEYSGIDIDEFNRIYEVESIEYLGDENRYDISKNVLFYVKIA